MLLPEKLWDEMTEAERREWGSTELLMRMADIKAVELGRASHDEPYQNLWSRRQLIGIPEQADIMRYLR